MLGILLNGNQAGTTNTRVASASIATISLVLCRHSYRLRQLRDAPPWLGKLHETGFLSTRVCICGPTRGFATLRRRLSTE